MARILAKAVNCLESPGAHPCGKCDACVGIAAGQDVDGGCGQLRARLAEQLGDPLRGRGEILDDQVGA